MSERLAAQEIADALGGKRAGAQWMARCPAHDDHNPSLAIRDAEHGVLVHCHAGCDQEAVLAALRERGLWSSSESGPHVTDVYDYRDEQGNLRHQTLRYSNPKSFKQRHPARSNPDPDNDKHWIWNLKGVRTVLYRLPELLAAAENEPVFVVEGEKDADRLIAGGLVATTCPMGAKKWRNDYSEWLRGRKVVVLADHDEPGEQHARLVAQSLRGIASNVQVIVFRTLPMGGDVSDWLDAGGSIEKLRARGRAMPALDRDRIISAPDLLELELPAIRWAVNDILPEGTCLCVGKTKIGKSMAAMGLGIAVASGGKAFSRLDVHSGPVLYLALEDNERRIQDRLRTMLKGDPPPENLHFVLRWPRLEDGCLERLRDWLAEHSDARLVIIDTLKMIRSQPDARQSVYDRDYESIQGLHELAGEFQVAILVLHHTRKAESDDPFDLVSGSNGLGAAADTVWIIQRKREEALATLFLGGREVETGSFILTWDPTVLNWNFKGEEEEYRLSEERQAVLDTVTDAGEAMAVREIAEALEKNFYTVRNLVQRMERDGVLQKLPGGKYAPAGSSRTRVITPRNRNSVGSVGSDVDSRHGDAENGEPMGVEQGRFTIGSDRFSKTYQNLAQTYGEPIDDDADFPHDDAENRAVEPIEPTTVGEQRNGEEFGEGDAFTTGEEPF